MRSTRTNLIHSLKTHCFGCVKQLYRLRVVFYPRGFCPLDTNSIEFPMGRPNRCHKGVWIYYYYYTIINGSRGNILMPVPFFLNSSKRTSIAMSRRLLNAGRKVRDACVVRVPVTWMMRRWDLVFQSVTRVERGEEGVGVVARLIELN